MELMKYSKIFALAAVLGLVTACGGNDNTTDEDQLADDVTAEEVHSNDKDNANSGLTLSGNIPAITTVYFDFDQSKINSEFQDVLNGHAAFLIENPEAKVILEGHCDERGTREYNNALGERRGVSVLNYLSLQGVNASQIEVISYGKERPAVRGNNEEAYRVNRRVEIKY